MCFLLAGTLLANYALAFFAQSQATFPTPPTDRTLVYYTDESNHLMALPFETGTSPLNADAVAKSDRHSYLELTPVLG
ncbi:MAG: hypothetical protein AUG51_02270 [Acidobacteria bacterium 13_1_20CM_3_53_8]|nr:MAG: hypothetical protein AUG51_02270 [Acidobacteria bacterium 13_1_20CM_3_53_8]